MVEVSSQPGCTIRPISRGIQTLSVPELESYDAVLWMMSPPCQPFTRNNTTVGLLASYPRCSRVYVWCCCGPGGVCRSAQSVLSHLSDVCTLRHQDKRDTADPRNQSFLHLCRLLRDMPRPPRFIALENVEVRLLPWLDRVPPCQWLLSDAEAESKRLLPALSTLCAGMQGFEASESCQLWLDTCVRRGYHVQQFILSPVQVSQVAMLPWLSRVD